MTITLIWAQAHGGVIGADGGIPWHLPEDSRRFRALTSGGDVVMGRKTWESLPGRFRPLPQRRNIVVTRDPEWSGMGAERAESIEGAIELAGDDVWIIGGGSVYRGAMAYADRLEVTQIDADIDGDARAPEVGPEWRVTASEPPTGWAASETGLRYRFLSYRRRTPEAPSAHQRDR